MKAILAAIVAFFKRLFGKAETQVEAIETDVKAYVAEAATTAANVANDIANRVR